MTLKLRLSILALLTAVVLAACGTSNTENEETNEVEEEQDETVVDEEETTDEAGNDQVESDDMEGDTTDEDTSGNDQADPTSEYITETGVYNGQADPHTIEIETAEGPVAFQLSMEARDLIEGLEPGDEVKYEYAEDGDNREIQTIEKVE